MKNIYDVICCPVCGARLSLVGKSLVCESAEKRHVYDVASSGYVNLLPPGRKKNAVTGDSRELVRSRTAFLSTGHYDAVSDAAAHLAAKLVRPSDGPFAFADFGCGEGYHTCRIAGALADKGVPVVGVGFDASKYAAEAGAKRAARSGFSTLALNDSPRGAALCFFAGNFFRPPVFPSSLSCVISMFAPVAYGAADRVLREGGGIVVLIPGPDHLIEMRDLIYPNVRKREEPTPPPAPFKTVERTETRYTVRLTARETVDLFSMTPFSRRVPEEAQRRVTEAGEMTVTVDVSADLIVRG